jgi:hypothetical protein
MEGMTMERKNALQEFRKMWIWLYKHPAQDNKYYTSYVAKPKPSWRNDCPLCALSAEGECRECRSMWDTGHGSLCTDPDSPLVKWRKTSVDDPDNRTWYAGRLVEIAGLALK